MFELGDADPDKKGLWERSFPGQKYTETDYRTISSQLLKMAEHFLLLQNLDQKPLDKQLLLLDELDQRNLDKHLRYEISQSRKMLEKSPLRDGEHYLQEFRLNIQEHQWLGRTQARSAALAPTQAIQALDKWYLSTRLRYQAKVQNLSKIFNLETESDNEHLLDALLEKSEHRELALIKLYLLIGQLLRQNKESDYHQLKSILYQIEGLAEVELLEAFSYAINYTIQQANQGKTEYLSELFDLYKNCLERGLLFEKGYLSGANYKNMVTVGLRNGEHNWVKHFIADYRKKLRPSERENAYTYNLAKYHFTTANYDKALPLLQTVEYQDVFYNLDSKNMLLKIYYENQELESLYSLLESFSVFLRRNKQLSSYHKLINQNLIRFVKKLIRIPRGEKQKLESLQNSINESKQVADIVWLLKKVEEKK